MTSWQRYRTGTCCDTPYILVNITFPPHSRGLMVVGGSDRGDGDGRQRPFMWL